MKTRKLLLVLILGLVGFGANAQTFAPTGATWTYSQWHFMSPLIDTFKIRSVGDTIIQSKQCKILLKNEIGCDLREPKEFMYSDSGKVFFYDTSRHSFQMLYNFMQMLGIHLLSILGIFLAMIPLL